MTPRCIHQWVVDYEYEELHEYSTKFEYASGHAYWDQEKLFDENNRRRKILWNCSFKGRKTKDCAIMVQILYYHSCIIKFLFRVRCQFLKLQFWLSYNVIWCVRYFDVNFLMLLYCYHLPSQIYFLFLVFAIFFKSIFVGISLFLLLLKTWQVHICFLCSFL